MGLWNSSGTALLGQGLRPEIQQADATHGPRALPCALLYHLFITFIFILAYYPALLSSSSSYIATNLLLPQNRPQQAGILNFLFIASWVLLFLG